MSGAGGKLLRAALQFLKKAKRRNRPGRMTPQARSHTFLGDLKQDGSAGTGYHYRPGGEDFPGRRIVPGSVVRDTRTGAYRAEPEFWSPQQNAWVPKAGNGGVSSFFPDHWTPAQVDAAIPGAFNHATPIPGTNRWRGSYGGLTIEGIYDSAGTGFRHGWPIVP